MWNVCERRIKDDSRILAYEAVKMELLLTKMVKTLEGASLGKKTRDSLLNRSSLRS